MRCDADCLQDCVVAHLAPAFVLTCEKPGVQWSHGRCPACKAWALSLGIKGGRSLLWTCHRKPTEASPTPACEYGDILAAAVKKCPQCLTLPRKAKASTITLDELAALLTLGDPALRLRVASIAWQMTPKQAAEKLGMSRATYYRAVSDVRQNRRSA